jgi:hypothetical protein
MKWEGSMLLLEIILFIILITLSILIRIDYEKRGKRRWIGHFVHFFFNRDLYNDMDQLKETNQSEGK